MDAVAYLVFFAGMILVAFSIYAFSWDKKWTPKEGNATIMMFSVMFASGGSTAILWSVLTLVHSALCVAV